MKMNEMLKKENFYRKYLGLHVDLASDENLTVPKKSLRNWIWVSLAIIILAILIAALFHYTASQPAAKTNYEKSSVDKVSQTKPIDAEKEKKIKSILASDEDKAGENAASADTSNLTDVEKQKITMITKVKKAVVTVFNIGYQKNEPFVQASGSGFIYKITKNYAYIATNEHVVSDAKDAMIQLSNDSTTDAQIIGTDVPRDVALIRISRGKLATKIPFFNSSNIAVGSTVIAMGEPQGLSNTVTEGIVSAVDRPMEGAYDDEKIVRKYNSIQIDAVISSGSSGGPVVNTAGQLIGMAVSGSLDEKGNQISGIGYAISSNTVKAALKDIEKKASSD